jgi:hypothetical protein
MPSPWDANIKLLYATDLNTFFTIDDVARGDSFDVIANVEIGENLNENVDSFDLRVGIVNLTQSSSVDIQTRSGALTPQNNTPFFDEIRLNIPGNWSARAEVGDVLQAVASYKVTAGANVDFSTALSNTFVVS